jgi:hypothetical protein
MKVGSTWLVSNSFSLSMYSRMLFNWIVNGLSPFREFQPGSRATCSTSSLLIFIADSLKI